MSPRSQDPRDTANQINSQGTAGYNKYDPKNISGGPFNEPPKSDYHVYNQRGGATAPGKYDPESMSLNISRHGHEKPNPSETNSMHAVSE